MLRASDTGRAEGGGTASIFYSEIPAPRIGAHPSNHTTTFLWLCFKGLNNMTYNIRCCVAFISFLWLPRYLCFYRTYSGGLRLHFIPLGFWDRGYTCSGEVHCTRRYESIRGLVSWMASGVFPRMLVQLAYQGNKTLGREASLPRPIRYLIVFLLKRKHNFLLGS